MSLESGGRADKIGNSYENRYLAKLLLRLVEETYTSVEVEPLGTENDGVEYITTSSDGSRIYYQCKASNGPESKWTFAPLRDLNVFDNARKHVIDSTDHYYHFISPIPYALFLLPLFLVLLQVQIEFEHSFRNAQYYLLAASL